MSHNKNEETFLVIDTELELTTDICYLEPVYNKHNALFLNQSRKT